MTFTVDIHHHILPDFVWQVSNEQHGPDDGVAPVHRSAAGALSSPDCAFVTAQTIAAVDGQVRK
jgi:hypothetical protein